MFYRLNNTNIITGYIKELLKEFNLPSLKYYRPGISLYDDRLYLKDKQIFKCINGELVKTGDYIYNQNYNNLTRNLVINSSVYDSYTHTYLGDYLRFLRDYNNLNLMPLYNCFNTEKPVGLNYKVRIKKIDELSSVEFRIDTDDTKYNYYIVPIKFDETYTVAIDAQVGFEMACIIYTGDKVLDISKSLTSKSYKKYTGCSFTQPILYDTHIDATYFWPQEENLRLLIKIPSVVNSSVVVLEGDYTENCKHISGWSLDKKFPKLSLLRINDETYHPFATRLVEYLLGNAITHLDTIEYDVSRVQKVIYGVDGGKFLGYNDIWDHNIEDRLYELVNKDYRNKIAPVYRIEENNSSEEEPKTLLFDKLKFIDTVEDSLGYVDKDTEQYINSLYYRKETE